MFNQDILKIISIHNFGSSVAPISLCPLKSMLRTLICMHNPYLANVITDERWRSLKFYFKGCPISLHVSTRARFGGCAWVLEQTYQINKFST